jgi:hypothetical protein
MLKQKEKDNTSPMLRATYLFSNVGDLVKCYGRSIRFPSDARAYQTEMKLALGDIIMQCRMIENENNKQMHTTRQAKPNDDTVGYIIGSIVHYTSLILIDTTTDENDTENHSHWFTSYTLNEIQLLCDKLNWNFEEISHLGFLHVCERFEQFEREGWE